MRRVAATNDRVYKGISSEPISIQTNGQSEALPPQSLEPKAPSLQPAFEQVRVIDKLAELITELERLELKLCSQAQQLTKAVPDGDTIKSYLDHAIDLLCPQKAECEALARKLRHQMDKWEMANFYWQDRGDREGWKLDSMMPDFLKSLDRKQWETRLKELVKINDRLTQKIDINNHQLQKVVTYLNSPLGKYTVETARDNMINSAYPHWHNARNQKEQIEQKLKFLRGEIIELEKVKNDLNRHYPNHSVAMTSEDNIRERIKRPDILHLIRLIEQVESKKLNSKRREEMKIGRR